MTEAERHLAYAEAQVNHADHQLRPLLACIFGSALPQLRAIVGRERDERDPATKPP
jgi:hypothetical protein